jgi:phosphoglycerol transferase MdoB-like AlkP superfamily enzyme
VCVDYKSLFGYGWWGTFWRVVVVYKFAYLFMASIIILTVLYDRLVLSIGGDLSIPVLLVRLLCFIALIMLVILVIDMINRKSWRTAGWLKALRLPLITLGVLLVLLVVGEIIRPGGLSAIFDMLFLE